MSTIKQLRYQPPQPETPRCEAHRKERYANDTPSTDKRCFFSSSYLIGSMYLCTRHAGKAALKILLEKESS